MTIATEIQRLQDIKSEIMAALERKNVDTTGKNMSDVGDLIRSISGDKLYKLDIPNLKLYSHTMDNGLQCSFTNPSAFSIDGQSLVANNYYDFSITNLQILGNITEIEIICDLSHSSSRYYTYIGSCHGLLRYSWDTSNFACWLGTNTSGTNWVHKSGSYFPGTTQGNVRWTSHQGVTDFTSPVTIRTQFYDGIIKLYFNDTLIAEKENDLAQYPELFNFIMNSGGESNISTTVLKSLTIKYN